MVVNVTLTDIQHVDNVRGDGENNPTVRAMQRQGIRRRGSFVTKVTLDDDIDRNDENTGTIWFGDLDDNNFIALSSLANKAELAWDAGTDETFTFTIDDPEVTL